MKLHEKMLKRALSKLLWTNFEKYDPPFMDFLDQDLNVMFDAPDTEWGKAFKIRVSKGHYNTCFGSDFRIFKIASKKDIKTLKAHILSLEQEYKVQKISCPNTDKVLDNLKDFQLATVDYVYKQLYDNGKSRFLVADEVGLGKTLIAKGVIAKAVNRLWNEKETDANTPLRIDIVYICSNTAIAKQNINKLTIPGITGHVEPTRITMLAESISQFDPRLNFIALTPGTSFEVNEMGWVRERAFIYIILKRIWGLKNCSRNSHFFMGNASRQSFDYEVETIENQYGKKLNETIINNFKRLLENEKPSPEDVFYKISGSFGKERFRNCSDERWSERRDFIILMRELLAKASISALSPDLIILDEFQRFRDLLGDPHEEGITEDVRDMRELAKELFQQKTAKILLLSATPYKMYTIHDDVDGEDHHSDFMKTVLFLLNMDKAKTTQFEQNLIDYRRSLFSTDESIRQKIKDKKTAIEKDLRNIMVRTERFYYIKDPRGFIDDGDETKRDIGNFVVSDIRSYSSLQRLSEIVHLGYVMEYWKSAPYLLNFMEDYITKKNFVDFISKPKLSYKKLEGQVGELLDFKKIDEYEAISMSNTRLRTLISQVIGNEDAGPWQLLWIPATIPYWEPVGVFKDQEITKTLLFSNWKVVPKAIGLTVSYEAERRIFKNAGSKYFQETRAIRLIEFPKKTSSDGGDVAMGRMSNFTLLYPSYTLAKTVNPILIAQTLCDQNNRPTIEEMIKATADVLKEKFASHTVKSEDHNAGGRKDQRWIWAFPFILDKLDMEIKTAYDSWMSQRTKAYYIEDEDKKESANLGEYLDELYAIKIDAFGPLPDEFWLSLAKVSLGSPAIIALRTLLNKFQQTEIFCLEECLLGASRIAMAFRALFNQPEAIRILRASDDGTYWKTILTYCIDGNLQSVFDEYIHVLADVEGLSTIPPVAAIDSIVQKVTTAVSLRTSSGTVDEINVDHVNKEILRNVNKENKPRRMRYHFAMPFGQETISEDRGERDQKVRIAFNSPFRPFLLASTSIGQEGLDFHLYCHSIYHWNLPSNPIDMEQREGRINRFKGHVIRKNAVSLVDFKKIQFSGDIWVKIFDSIKDDIKNERHCELMPYWVIENGKHKILRHVPSLPMGRDMIKYKETKNTLVAYRIVLGQPRQQDLLEYLVQLSGGALNEDFIKQHLINLCPDIFLKKVVERNI